MQTLNASLFWLSFKAASHIDIKVNICLNYLLVDNYRDQKEKQQVRKRKTSTGDCPQVALPFIIFQIISSPRSDIINNRNNKDEVG
jgi:hypothetical protein